MNFQVGDRVVMSPRGKESFKNLSCNPHDEQGLIVNIKENIKEWWGLPIEVRWDNGIRNSYFDFHLTPVPVENITEEDLKELV